MKSKHHLAPLALCASLFLLGGCGHFQREWREAGKAESPSSPVAGRWEGRWQSDSPGHGGNLKCVVTETAEHRYRAHFHATYKGILRFTYVAELHGGPSNNVVFFSGTADLGKLAGGVYKYDGSADGTNYLSRYDSSYDKGSFKMARPR